MDEGMGKRKGRCTDFTLDDLNILRRFSTKAFLKC